MRKYLRKVVSHEPDIDGLVVSGEPIKAQVSPAPPNQQQCIAHERPAARPQGPPDQRQCIAQRSHQVFRLLLSNTGG